MRGITTLKIGRNYITKSFDLKTDLGVHGFNMEKKCFSILSPIGVCPEMSHFTDRSIVMKKGVPLKEWMEYNSGKEYTRMAVLIFKQLQKMHEHGVNHRDMHIDNVILMSLNNPVFIDFEFSTLNVKRLSYDIYGPEISGVRPHKVHKKPSYQLYWDCSNPRGIGKRLKTPLEQVMEIIENE